MCRLLGIYGSVEHWQIILLKFQELSETGKVPSIPDLVPGHKDGWGMASSKSDNSGIYLVGKYLGNALEAPEYEENVHSFNFQPQVFLCHLRKASPRIPISLPNSHPFLTSNWAFIHNGTIYNAEELKKSFKFQHTSDNSDSELLFHYILEDVIAEETVKSRTKRLTESLKQVGVEYSSLNFLLSNGSEMYAVRCAAQYYDYFSLFYYESSSAVIVCSETIDIGQAEYWSEMPNRSVLSISGSPPKVILTKF